ncbi:MAG: periplasmic heavy metal sensor [Thermoanaerobaculia bacterium]
MRRWWLVIALLLSVGLNLGILAAIGARRSALFAGKAARPPLEAGSPGAHPGADPVPRLARLADRLKLEGEPRRRFLDIQWNLYQETTRQRLQLNEVHRDLRREMSRPTPDRQRVEGLLNESARIYLALERSLVNNIFATRDLLDPEQQEEYLKIVGRLRVPGPGAGIGNPGAGAGQRRPGPMERLRQKRMRQERREDREGDGRMENEGPP